MNCYVYKGLQKQDHYVFTGQELDNLEYPDLPAAIVKHLGGLSFVLEFDLTPERSLQQADPVQVLKDIESQGFYLQMPKEDVAKIEQEYFS